MIKISLEQKQKIKEIAEKCGVLFVVVFGSAVTGKRSVETDLDIAVLTKKEPDYRLFKKLFSAFSDVFKGENADLRFLNGADPFFRFQVIKNGQLVYGNRQQYGELRIYYWKVFVDLRQRWLPYLHNLSPENQQKLEAKIFI